MSLDRHPFYLYKDCVSTSIAFILLAVLPMSRYKNGIVC